VRLNADLTQRVVIDTNAVPWVSSPANGVDRRMLDRIGDEVAVATTIVRYLPQTGFHSHTHGAGEEILVLQGSFSDEHGDYPPGTYLRNPPGTSHAPRPEAGCTIFVKLRQFTPGDTQQLVLRTGQGQWLDTTSVGVQCQPLHSASGIDTQLLRFAPGAVQSAQQHEGGFELLLLEGQLHDAHGSYAAGTWLRYPRGSSTAFSAGPAGAQAFVKTGHIGATFVT